MVGVQTKIGDVKMNLDLKERLQKEMGDKYLIVDTRLVVNDVNGFSTIRGCVSKGSKKKYFAVVVDLSDLGRTSTAYLDVAKQLKISFEVQDAKSLNSN